MGPIPDRGTVSASSRPASLPADWPALQGRVEILWDPHMIPYIHAQEDADVPFALGLVHAHLRLSQMEIIRRVARGRLAESGGPVLVGLDEAIRAIDLDRAVPEMAARLPQDTRLWLERYVRAINAYRERVGARGADYGALNLGSGGEWTVEDVLAVGRLASVDINWGRFLSLFTMREERGYQDYLERLRAFADEGVPSFGPQTPTPLDPLIRTGRSGSNAFVVSGARSAGAGALMASDPHLGLPQPNLWCVVGVRSPSHRVAGLTIPGLPFVLVGRNEHIGWSGTNMQASSTVLYRLSEDDIRGADVRTEKIATRWWWDAEREIRDSEHGPIVTDAKLLERLSPDGADVAMRWRGHEPSDEASTFLRISTARSWDDFRDAFSTYAVAGQNFLYADRHGRIGQLLALEFVPAAGRAAFAGPVDPDDERYRWNGAIPSAGLPSVVDPPEGFLVSANNVPIATEPPIVPQGNSNDRVLRIREVLEGNDEVSLDDLRALQRDTTSLASRRAAAAMVERARELPLSARARDVAARIERWDGRYEMDSRGAVAYQRVLDGLLRRGYRDRYSPKLRGLLRSAPYVHDFVGDDLRSGAIDDAAATDAFERAVRGDADTTWGQIHRLSLAHPLGRLPLIGDGYVFGEQGVAGSSTTVYKSAHRVSGDEHSVTFGANARIVGDLGTLDENSVVLLGGQDGWIGSEGMLDQIPLWQRGEMIPLPLSEEGQRARAEWRTVLGPAAARRAGEGSDDASGRGAVGGPG